jgi:hypothetical protein
MATKRKTLENKLDRIFSKYIRLRDSVDGEVVKCVTCGKFGHIKSMHQHNALDVIHSIKANSINTLFTWIRNGAKGQPMKW